MGAEKLPYPGWGQRDDPRQEDSTPCEIPMRVEQFLDGEGPANHKAESVFCFFPCT